MPFHTPTVVNVLRIVGLSLFPLLLFPCYLQVVLQENLASIQRDLKELVKERWVWVLSCIYNHTTNLLCVHNVRLYRDTDKHCIIYMCVLILEGNWRCPCHQRGRRRGGGRGSGRRRGRGGRQLNKVSTNKSPSSRPASRLCKRKRQRQVHTHNGNLKGLNLDTVTKNGNSFTGHFCLAPF